MPELRGMTRKMTIKTRCMRCGCDMEVEHETRYVILERRSDFRHARSSFWIEVRNPHGLRAEAILCEDCFIPWGDGNENEQQCVK
jgi:hypothetical protein